MRKKKKNGDFGFNGKKTFSFIADKELQDDQIKGKIVSKFNKSLFIWKSNTLKIQNDHKKRQKINRIEQFGAIEESHWIYHSWALVWNVLLFN